jgi:hypothetical protein
MRISLDTTNSNDPAERKGETMNITMKHLAGAMILGLLLFSQPAAAQTNIDAAMTVDNQFTAYLSTADNVQGTQIGTGNNWPTTYQFSAALTPNVTNYLHIVGTDTGPPAMFIGEFTLSNFAFEFANGTQTLLTNTANWQVSTTGFGVGYVAPSDLGGQGTSPWGNFPLIDAAARFIWHPVGPGNTVYFSAQIFPTGAAPASTRATFAVSKQFSDGNPGQVEVTISCNTGLPLEQSKDISEGDGVEFVVTDFDSGELDCSVTETALAGYDTEYSANSGGFGSSACAFEGVEDGGENSCEVRNTPAPVIVRVQKVWVYANAEGNEISNEFRIELECNAVIEGGYSIGGGWYRAHFESIGDDFNDFTVHPTFGGNSCHASETVFDSAVESDNSDCQNLSIDIGQGAECTIVNTVFFEGIPTLDQYGLAILALLMLGVGLAGFRRFA